MYRFDYKFGVNPAVLPCSHVSMLTELIDWRHLLYILDQ